MSELNQTGFDEFDRLSALVQRTREVLDALLQRGTLPAGGADYLAATTLPHVERVEAGFRSWLRADQADLAELQYLVAQVGSLRAPPAGTAAERRAAMHEGWLEASRSDRPRRLDVTGAAWDLLGLAHARLVLAQLPRLPESEVRYPAGRRTYADISAPRSPAELAARIEELERELWRTATGRQPGRLDPAFRRTYGFFDAAERLGRRALGAA
ncbi:MAG TPA: hypothetical protein VIV06_09585 [Candidatus Limnocylindrales bacterium]